MNNEVTIINGVSQKMNAKNLQEVEEALTQQWWIAIKNCLSDIAVMAQEFLIFNKDSRSKYWVTNTSVPKDLRSNLLTAFVENAQDEKTMNWILQQSILKDSDKEKLIQKLVDLKFFENNPNAADQLIKHMQVMTNWLKLCLIIILIVMILFLRNNVWKDIILVVIPIMKNWLR